MILSRSATRWRATADLTGCILCEAPLRNIRSRRWTSWWRSTRATPPRTTRSLQACAPARRSSSRRPGCHKEARSRHGGMDRADADGPLGDVLRHGIYAERHAEMATDALRAFAFGTRRLPGARE